MPRTPNDAPITTKAARDRLPAQSKPHWRSVEGGTALGYRRSVQGGGAWVARVLIAGRYVESRLGRADDMLPTNGVDVLDFRQAQARAVAWAARQGRIAAGLEAEPVKGPVKLYTVADAVADYLAEMAARKARSVDSARISAAAFILPTLGAVPVARLTREKLRTWHRALAAAPPRRRTSAKPGQPVKPAAAPNPVGTPDPDARRRREATANRILTNLKAALNYARNDGKYVGSDDAWTTVKPFKDVDAPKVRYLSDDEAVRLANACNDDFRALVTAALHTGCRYGELISAKVGDFDAKAGTLHIASSNSKSGKARHVALAAESRTFFIAAAVGRSPDALLFERDAVERQATRREPAKLRRAAWQASDQFRAIAAACEAARIAPAISFHVLRHTYASRLAARAVPMPVIAAQLGHGDTRMTEKHYAHLAPSYVADTVRAAFGSYGFDNDSNATVVAIADRKQENAA